MRAERSYFVSTAGVTSLVKDTFLFVFVLVVIIVLFLFVLKVYKMFYLIFHLINILYHRIKNKTRLFIGHNRFLFSPILTYSYPVYTRLLFLSQVR